MDNVVTSPQLMDLETFKSEMDTKGWVIFHEVLEDSFREELIKAQDIATEECRQIQIKNGVVNRTAGTSHHLVVFEGPFMKFVEEMPLHEYLTAYFDNGPYILNSFGGVMNFKAETSSYVGNVHRDIRTWSGDLPLMMNMLVMLDDFTPENGATWFMSGSHKYAEKPTDEEFFAVAEQAVAKKGSIVLFNSNVWHAAGTNQTDQIRRGLTPMFTKPFFKPQFDYSRYFGYDRVANFPPLAKQLLGYNSRVPANLDEWYQVPEKRLYIPGQG
ncbi:MULTISPECIES: phytanoyl-CoA dioxygenase family protein [unclassified Siphonobacter]|uniref:phytanoyl-CoA dioxygenase family protein n=1 Tax=unclassified Siphonobacter TaxID=2635712 RepID=UPI00277E33AB|nr:MULTISPECIES: phytanoyl-CoA dioxygenase family protein [unclassified Siphonobacter]MDQ1088740.1 ectoine hydroxylase-related dioxygenase (phytanoyl-CoA dioxygenase family) [Siphonobacter sp. SORGH_AS_1065]MDR6194885.1 ectoine hydroxylase-related dioxygenase (phytanoyl-CoA dioxygenase family) [Siphonobacter sp. SORGH_AS_0500]